MPLFYFDKQNLHHAYLIEGEKESVLPELYAQLENLGFPVRGNPDLWVREFDTFTIEDARSLRSRAGQRAMDERNVFVVATNVFSREAQNALLKALEDPAPNTHFFFIMPRVDSILPTLRSRFHIVSAKEGAAGSNIDIGEFLGATAGKRFEILQGIIKEKDKEGAIQFLNALETELHKGDARKHAEVLADIQNARGYLSDRAPSVKMLLEYVALAAPRSREHGK